MHAAAKKPILDTGAVRSVCPLRYDPSTVPKKGQQVRLRAVTGHVAEYHGDKRVETEATSNWGRKVKVLTTYGVSDVHRPVIAAE